MNVDPKLATEVAKIVAKELYGDAFAPAAREVGTALGDLARTMRVAGLEFGAITRERIERLFTRALSEVPPERRIPPSPELLGPILEGVRYREEGTPLEEAFRRLLSRASDSQRVSEAHPSFPGFINRISPDEAVILRYMSDNGPLQIKGDIASGIVSVYQHQSLPKDLPIAEGQMLLYMDNLRSCGLLKAVYKDALTGGGAVNLTPGYGVPRGQRPLVVSLTPLGGAFVGACLAKD